MIALIYLIREDFKVEIKKLDKKDYCILFNYRNIDTRWSLFNYKKHTKCS